MRLLLKEPMTCHVVFDRCSARQIDNETLVTMHRSLWCIGEIFKYLFWNAVPQQLHYCQAVNGHNDYQMH